MFSFDERFLELWSLIPTIVTSEDYCGLANEIDDARTGREITYRDEIVLLKALELFKDARGISEV